ncbi:MAG: phage tail tape measure protein [Candidatus Contendobacter sp.]|nr:phage tail tape measure protein [Candidatus Contendobacter sp.]
MADRNLVLQLLITAKDQASGVFSKLFSSLNDGTNVIAGKVRDGFSNLFGGAVDSAAAFEQQLGKVQAKGDETYQDTAELKKGLQTLAAQFGITGTEAAQGMEVLAAASLNATDAMKALPAVLNLAKMENLSLDDAATKLSDTLSIMGMEFSQAGTMADVLAKGANISTASAASLAEALSVAGGQAKSAGMDLQATVAALDLLHSAGIKGSAAGTSLSAILTQLQNPASAASKELNKLGINSRDLGDVLDGLNAAGGKSGAAILAFGETAGPGLQAMVSKGAAGLKDYDTQLRKAGGSAAEAADKLDQNFNSALSRLAAAWDSIKAALAEPILKPIADGAREVAKTLNEALISGALKPAQAAIKTFATEGIAAIRDFVKNFDFQQAIKAAGDFLTSAKTSFEEIKTAGNTAADGVTIAWNAVTAGFKTIGAALLAIASQTVSALAATEEAASKVGMGSLERANELRQTASALAATAAELVQSVAQDSVEMGAAYDRMTGKTGEAQAAQERLKTAFPTNEIQTLSYTLADYQTIADRANAATEAARIAHEAGKITAQEYGVKLLEAADANQALNVATLEQAAGAAAQQAQADKVTLATAELTGKLANWSREIKYANEMADKWQSGMALNEVKMLGLRDAAQATAEKLAYLTSVKATLPDADKKIAAATAENKAALDRYNTALGEHITQLEAKQAAVERANGIEQKGYDLLIQQARAEEELATLKGDTEAATRAQTDATDLQNEKAAAAIAQKNQEIAVYKDLIAATKEKLAADGTLDQADQAHLATMADTLTAMGQERDSMAQSLQATKDLTEAKRQKKEADEAAAKAAKEAAEAEKEALAQLAAAGDAVNSNMTAVNQAFVETGGNMEKLTSAFNEMRTSTVNGLSADPWIAWSASVAANADKVVQSYNNQKSALDNSVATLQRFADEGGNVAEIQRIMAQGSGNLANQYSLLDEQDLSKLRSAMDSANDKLREMQQEAQDAQTALAELNAEILAEQGNTAAADKLKLQISQTSALTELERKLAEARGIGNKELIAIYQQQINKTNELYALKNRNLDAEIAGNDKTTKTNQAAITSANALTSAMKQSAEAVKILNGADLSGLVESSGQALNNFKAIKGLM